MIVLYKSKMKDGTKIQVEDWSKEYKFMEYGTTIATYPISKSNGEGQFSPKTGRTFRVIFTFNSHNDTIENYEKLANDDVTLLDLKEHMNDKNHLLFL